MRRYLITGGAGFIGSHLADALLARGDAVSIIDDLSTGTPANLAHLRDHPRFAATIDTCANRAVLAAQLVGCDGVFHLASAVGVKLVVDAPAHTISSTFHLAEAVLDLAAAAGVPVLCTSSSEVYGKSDRLPFREADDLVLGATTRSRWSYACAKAAVEFLALAHARSRSLPVVIARLFNTVGPRQLGNYGMVLPNFVRSALAGEPLRIHGDGAQTRCFAHVADVVRALISLIDTPACHGEVFNVGSTEEISIRDLAALVRERAASRSELIFIPYAAAYGDGFEDLPRRVPDTSKIAAAIGWRPAIGLRQIIDDVIAGS